MSFSCAVNSALSDMERYCLSWYFFSSACSCAVVKGVRGFLEEEEEEEEEEEGKGDGEEEKEED